MEIVISNLVVGKWRYIDKRKREKFWRCGFVSDFLILNLYNFGYYYKRWYIIFV